MYTVSEFVGKKDAQGRWIWLCKNMSKDGAKELYMLRLEKSV